MLLSICADKKQLLRECNEIKDTIWQNIGSLGRGVEPIDRELIRIRHRIRDAARSFNHITQEYSKAWCGPFCSELYNRLPRELRDMICEYLNVEHEFASVENDAERMDNASKSAVCPFKIGYLSSCHFSQESFVGPALRKEVVEHWFGSCIFNVEDRLELIPPFLLEDRTKISILPKDLIKGISFTVTREHLFLDKKSVPFEDKLDSKSCERLLQHLKPLLDIKYKTAAVTIRLCLGPRSWNWQFDSRRGNTVALALKIVFPVVERLHDAGFQIKVLIPRTLACTTLLTPNNVEFSSESWLEESRRLSSFN